MRKALQRKCACGDGGSACRCDERTRVQRSVTSLEEERMPAPSAIATAPQGAGRPLDDSVRSRFESSFGFDFSSVRVHTDHSAANAARAMNANAYTIGHNIVFGEAQFTPQSAAGEKLLAHELTHVVQQHAHSPAAGAVEVSHPDDPAEHEAERVAASLDRRRSSVSVTQRAHGIARQPKPKSAQEQRFGPPPTMSPKMLASMQASMADIEARNKLWISIFQHIDVVDKYRPQVAGELLRLLPERLTLWNGQEPLVTNKSSGSESALSTAADAVSGVLVDSMLARGVTLLLAPAVVPEILIALVIGIGVELVKKAFEKGPDLAECERVVLDSRYMELAFSLDRAIVKVLGKGAPKPPVGIKPAVAATTYVTSPLGGTLPKAFGK